MTNNEAKFVLSACRPNGADAIDPAMAEAFVQMRNDPTLSAWFAHEQAHARAVAGKLREIVPPAGLKEAILAGARAGKQIRRAPTARWRQPAWLAMAASVVIFLGFVSWWRFVPVGGADLREFAVNFVARGFLLEKRSADVTELKTWLAERRGPLPTELPLAFDRLRALGCRKLDFQGRDVSLICFERGGKEFHVFVAQRSDFPNLPAQLSPAFSAGRNLVAATWSDARNHYVVVSDAQMAELRQLL